MHAWLSEIVVKQTRSVLVRRPVLLTVATLERGRRRSRGTRTSSRRRSTLCLDLVPDALPMPAAWHRKELSVISTDSYGA